MIRLVLLSLLSAGPTYCDGYRQGFAAAYCAGHTPECLKTVPQVACYADGTVQAGYAAGYTEGERIHPPHTGQR